MKIGLTELVLILLIGALTVGPSVALWVDKWMRRAQRSSAAAARRRAAQRAQAAAERQAVLKRFQKLSIVFAVFAVIALVWALVLRPIEAEPKAYTAPDAADTVRQSTAGYNTIETAGYKSISCIRQSGDWVYLSAQQKSSGFSRKTTSALLRMQPDGSGLSAILTVEGEITGFDLDADGNIWYTLAAVDGGALCRASYDGWGAASEQIVTQIDGKNLSSPTAVVIGADGKVYFANAAAASASNGEVAALRTELMAHTATGAVYVYDPASRNVQQVLGCIAGASGLAISADGTELYVSDMGSRCVWAVSCAGRELTAGGKNCDALLTALPGYPSSLAVDDDGVLYIGYMWAQSNWLEGNASGTLLRGAALRLSSTMQENLFSLSASDIAAESFDINTGTLVGYTGKNLGSVAAICPAGTRLYFGTVDAADLKWAGV